MDSVASALRRYGGVMVAPRQAVARLRRGEGRYDGVILGLLYVFAVGSYDLIEGVAGLVATRDLGGLLMVASAAGRLALPPVLLLVAAETLLGESRAHRRGLALLPLLAVGVVAHELVWLGVKAPNFAPELLGALGGLLLTWRIRPAVKPDAKPQGAA